jgi:hypothetical protein
MVRRIIFLTVQVIVLAPIAVSLLSLRPSATLRYKKETDKECTFCHTGIPRKGDEDPKLNEDGRKFQDNGYRLTDEQKRRVLSPDTVPAH